MQQEPRRVFADIGEVSSVESWWWSRTTDVCQDNQL